MQYNTAKNLTVTPKNYSNSKIILQIPINLHFFSQCRKIYPKHLLLSDLIPKWRYANYRNIHDMNGINHKNSEQLY